MSAHTPGPWGLERTTVNMGGFNVKVWRVTVPDWTPLDLMNEPDANLIAAAPELYGALEQVVADYQFSAGKRSLDQVYAKTHPVMAALAAIAKARGEA